MNISTLPNPAIFMIASHLDLKDIMGMMLVCKRFSIIKTWELFWCQVLKNYLFVSPNIAPGLPNAPALSNLKLVFQKLKTIRSSLLHSYSEYGLASVPQLRPLAVFDHAKAGFIVGEFEKKWAGQLPLELYLTYLALTRQSEIKELIKSQNPGLEIPYINFLGGFSYYDRYFEFDLEELHAPECHFLLSAGFYTVIKERNSGLSIMMDTKNKLGFGDSAIFSILRFEQNPSDGQTLCIFLVDTSLTNYLSRLFNKQMNQEKGYIDLIDTVVSPGSDTTTQGIRIRATAIFNPWDAKNDEKLFVYQVRISDGGIPAGKKYKLQTRKWVVQEGPDNHTSVKIAGPGVIGLYPEVFKDCPDFIYESCTPIKASKGLMRGSFKFKERATGTEIKAKINPFKLEVGENCALLKYIPSKNMVLRVDE